MALITEQISKYAYTIFNQLFKKIKLEKNVPRF
jgi:hypothetical protein